MTKNNQFKEKLLKIIKNQLFWVLLLALISLFIKLINLNYPDWQIFDEIYYYNFGKDYLSNNYFFDVHPSLGKLIIAIGLFLFNQSLFGARFFQALLGSSLIYILYILSSKIFKNKTIGLFAAILVFFETSIFIESRYALINIFIVFFSLISYYYFWLFRDKKNIKYFFYSLFFTSLAVSVKWTASANLLVYFMFILFDKESFTIVVNYLYKNFFKFIFYIFVSLIFPYLLLFIPDYLKGDRFISWHYNAYVFHKNLNGSHPYASRWYKWFLDLRPVWLEYKETTSKEVIGIIEYGNPLIIYGSTLSFVYLFIKNFFVKNKALMLILLTITINTIPWIIITRESFYYHFIPILPFMIILLAYILNEFYKKNKFIVILYLIYTGCFFLYFWPFLNGLLIPFTGYTNRIIFSFLR